SRLVGLVQPFEVWERQRTGGAARLHEGENDRAFGERVGEAVRVTLRVDQGEIRGVLTDSEHQSPPWRGSPWPETGSRSVYRYGPPWCHREGSLDRVEAHGRRIEREAEAWAVRVRRPHAVLRLREFGVPDPIPFLGLAQVLHDLQIRRGAGQV